MLTTGADNIKGSGANDTFTGFIGTDNDTLQSDDMVNGGAGTDTLDVTLANTPFAITPRSTGVEVLKVRSQANGDDQGTNDVQAYTSPITKNLTKDNDPGVENKVSTIVTKGDNTIDAQNMVGANQFWSSNSRADLVIEDVRNNSHETTLGFQSTDPGDVDYAVFFDPSHITAPGSSTSGASLTVRLADVYGLKKDTNGLKNLPYTAMTVVIGGKDVVLDIDFSKLTDAAEYTQFAAAINAALVKAGVTTVTATVGAAEKAVFSTNVAEYLQGEDAGNFNPIVLTNSGPEAITLKGYKLATDAQEPNGNLVRTYAVNEQSTVPSLTQVNVILDDVGRGSMAGDFLAGSMSTGTSGSKGIAQFNVSVDRNSHITTLQTTNNGLEVVNVKNIGANGNLKLDDNNLTDEDYGLTDVRVFNASTMTGKVTLSAELSKDVVAKYMDLVDTNAPGDDNSDNTAYRDVVDQEFSYDLGKGDDSLYLNIAKENLAYQGSTTREDFALTIDSGAGKDTVTVQIGKANETSKSTAPWFINSNHNRNLNINTGEGDDTVNLNGAGTWNVTAGAGNDTVYSDNSGEKEVWVFNTANQTASVIDKNNLVSDANDSHVLYKGTVQVTFKGLTTVATEIASTNYATSDLQINQAIKKAINSDAVLNKLLIAKDGPANTLIVESLIDGSVASASVLDVTFAQATLSTAEQSAANAALGITYSGTAAVTALNTAGESYDAAFESNGAPSENSTANIIEGGAGNDVIVLSAGNEVTNTSPVIAKDTVVFKDAFDTDTIVNFTAGVTGDVLNFKAIGATVTRAADASFAAGTTSAEAVAAFTTGSTTNAVAANHVVIMHDGANVARVYQVVDAVNAGTNTATLMGTIDLADVKWTDLGVANFA